MWRKISQQLIDMLLSMSIIRRPILCLTHYSATKRLRVFIYYTYICSIKKEFSQLHRSSLSDRQQNCSTFFRSLTDYYSVVSTYSRKSPFMRNQILFFAHKGTKPLLPIEWLKNRTLEVIRWIGEDTRNYFKKVIPDTVTVFSIHNHSDPLLAALRLSPPGHRYDW